jgi:hypothetical protein
MLHAFLFIFVFDSFPYLFLWKLANSNYDLLKITLNYVWHKIHPVVYEMKPADRRI